MVDLISANHTGRELALMLSGKKPLAMFYAEISELPDESLIPDGAFAPYVTSGQFVRGEITLESGYSVSLGRNAQIRYVFFAPAASGLSRQRTVVSRESCTGSSTALLYPTKSRAPAASSSRTLQ